MAFKDDATGSDNLDERLKQAEEAVLKAKADYSLRNQIIEYFLMVDPILTSVHSGERRTPREWYGLERGSQGLQLTRDSALSALIDRRDVLSMAHANIASDYKSAMESLVAVQRENRLAMQRNRELTSTLLSLVEETKVEKIGNITNPDMKGQLETLEVEVSVRKPRWTIMKNVISAVIAGSGVDWARDEKLRELVLDSDGEPIS